MTILLVLSILGISFVATVLQATDEGLGFFAQSFHFLKLRRWGRWTLHQYVTFAANKVRLNRFRLRIILFNLRVEQARRNG